MDNYSFLKDKFNNNFSNDLENMCTGIDKITPMTITSIYLCKELISEFKKGIHNNTPGNETLNK